jgi:hypothetical protein
MGGDGRAETAGRPMSDDHPDAGAIYFEFAVQGAFVRVSAIDAETGLEAVIVGPSHAPRAQLERLALRKLDYLRAGRADLTPPGTKGT